VVTRKAKQLMNAWRVISLSIRQSFKPSEDSLSRFFQKEDEEIKITKNAKTPMPGNLIPV
jgi:hypothetical protein